MNGGRFSLHDAMDSLFETGIRDEDELANIKEKMMKAVGEMVKAVKGASEWLTIQI